MRTIVAGLVGLALVIGVAVALSVAVRAISYRPATPKETPRCQCELCRRTRRANWSDPQVDRWERGEEPTPNNHQRLSK